MTKAPGDMTDEELRVAREAVTNALFKPSGEFGQALSDCMAKANISPTELARKTGVPLDDLLRVCKGQNRLSLKTADKLAAVLGCPVADLRPRMPN